MTIDQHLARIREKLSLIAPDNTAAVPIALAEEVDPDNGKRKFSAAIEVETEWRSFDVYCTSDHTWEAALQRAYMQLCRQAINA